MTLTPSNMLPLGTRLPKFELEVVPSFNSEVGKHHLINERISSNSISSKPLLLMVLCAHCPFVKHVEAEISRIDNDYCDRINLIALSSNSLITHPQDGPEQLAEQAEKNSWSFPYLFDQEQSLAKALQAACTPDFFLFAPSIDGEQTLRYRGQLDASRPSNKLKVNGQDLRLAIDCLLEGEEVAKDQKPSIGCNIKWHPGKEPSWFG